MTTEKVVIPMSRMEIVFATCVRDVDSLGMSPTSSIRGPASASTSGVLALERSDVETERIDDASLPPYVFASDAFNRGELSDDSFKLVAGEFFVIFNSLRCCSRHQSPSAARRLDVVAVARRCFISSHTFDLQPTVA